MVIPTQENRGNYRKKDFIKIKDGQISMKNILISMIFFDEKQIEVMAHLRDEMQSNDFPYNK